ncbi:hypothetical protein NKH16_34485, partial [Mesorhizobium sp. M1307]|uniref:hypothetical protein n=1 Tax=Mesorhizobium sp. M1307 TaxID=2957079 RepID=UPI003334D8DD
TNAATISAVNSINSAFWRFFSSVIHQLLLLVRFRMGESRIAQEAGPQNEMLRILDRPLRRFLCKSAFPVLTLFV